MTDIKLKGNRLPSLDGWRAVAIMLVLGGHSVATEGFPTRWRTFFGWTFNGNLGVRMFFVVSGFLITWLLLLEHERSKRVNLRHFYARRALRILPVYLTFLAFVALVQVVTPFSQTTGEWLANLTFTTGLIPAQNWTTGHLWSLAVEEQFYIVWPGLCVLARIADHPRRAMYLLAVPLLMAPVFRVMGYARLAPPSLEWMCSPYTFFHNFDSLAIGCAAAVLLANKGAHMRCLLTNRRQLVVVAALLMIAVPAALRGYHLLGFLTVPFGDTLQGFGMVILLVQSVLLPRAGFYALLNQKAVAWVGALSYSLYIWQQIFCTRPAAFGLEKVWWMSFPGWLVSTLIVSCASFYMLEQPFMKLRAKFRDS